MTRKRKTKPATWKLAEAELAGAPLNDSEPVRRRPRPVSAKRRALLAAYGVLRDAFIQAKRESYWPFCEVAWAAFCVKLPATEVHHMRGRAWKLLLDDRHWLAVSRRGHQWIHQHPEEARKRGWLAQRGEWGKQT